MGGRPGREKFNRGELPLATGCREGPRVRLSISSEGDETTTVGKGEVDAFIPSPKLPPSEGFGTGGWLLLDARCRSAFGGEWSTD